MNDPRSSHLLFLSGWLFLVNACGPDPVKLEREYERGMTAFRNEQLEEARIRFRGIYETDPEYRQTALTYGKILFFAGVHDEATPILEVAAEREGAVGQIWLARNLGKTDEGTARALEILEEVVTAYPENTNAWLLKGHLHDRLDQIEQAIVCYREVLRVQSNVAGAHAALGSIYERSRLPAKAAPHFARARNLGWENDPEEDLDP